MLLKDSDQIVVWLDKYKVKNYTLRQDETYSYVVDIEGNVYLNSYRLNKIGVKFGHVSGDFLCCNNQFTSLLGCPKHVGRDFHCSANNLTSLEGAPLTIGGNFLCYHNKLTSLLGCPKSVGRTFNCDDNQLTSLDGMPEIGGYFNCDKNSDLGELQDIHNLSEVRAYLLSKKLAEQSPQDLDNQKNNRKIKL